MKIIVGGQVIGEVENFTPSRAGEPGVLDLTAMRPNIYPSTVMVVWDEDFAIDQLERMMRAPHAFAPPASMNPCAEIPL